MVPVLQRCRPSDVRLHLFFFLRMCDFIVHKTTNIQCGPLFFNGKVPDNAEFMAWATQFFTNHTSAKIIMLTNTQCVVFIKYI